MTTVAQEMKTLEDEVEAWWAAYNIRLVQRDE